MTRISRGPLLAAALAAGASGCLSRNAAEPVRYFRPVLVCDSPVVIEAHGAASAAEQKPAPLALRIRRVGAAAHLRDRIAHRVSEVEVTYSDLVRWTEPPLGYVERELGRILFEKDGLVRAESSGVPRLDLELRAFEEVRTPGGEAARVIIWAALVDAHDAPLFDRRFVAQSDLPAGADPTSVANGLTVALTHALSDLEDAIVDGLKRARK